MLWSDIQVDEFINSYAALRSIPDTSADVACNVKEWLAAYGNAIDMDEAAFVEKDDLCPVTATSRTPLRRALESIPAFRTRSVFQRKAAIGTKSSPVPTTVGTTYYYSDKRIDSVVNVLICIAGFSLLVIPLWILLYVSSKQNQLIVITVFIAFFLTIIQSVSVARPFESLAATAA